MGRGQNFTPTIFPPDAPNGTMIFEIVGMPMEKRQRLEAADAILVAWHGEQGEARLPPGRTHIDRI